VFGATSNAATATPANANQQVLMASLPLGPMMCPPPYSSCEFHTGRTAVDLRCLSANHHYDGSMKRSAVEILREYEPFPGIDHADGVTCDGQHVWFAAGDKLNAFDPASQSAPSAAVRLPARLAVQQA